jgi:hypothetical protein
MSETDAHDKYIQPLGFYIGTADSSRTHRYGILFAMLGSTLLVNFFAPANGLTGLGAFLLLTGLYLIAILAVKRGDVVRDVIEDLEKKLEIKSSYPPKTFFDSKVSVSFLYSAAIAEIAGFGTQSLRNLNLLIAFGTFFVALVISTTVAKRI